MADLLFAYYRIRKIARKRERRWIRRQRAPSASVDSSMTTTNVQPERCTRANSQVVGRPVTGSTAAPDPAISALILAVRISESRSVPAICARVRGDADLAASDAKSYAGSGWLMMTPDLLA